MYVAVKGGEQAIKRAHKWLDEIRRGDINVQQLQTEQIIQQLPFLIDRVMSEGGLYDKQLAALAIKQSAGDLNEAIFLIRTFRTTLGKLGYSKPLDTQNIRLIRRISAAFKDLPGGQILGPTFDYTHRLLNFNLFNNDSNFNESHTTTYNLDNYVERIKHKKVFHLLDQENLIKHNSTPQDDTDITLEPLKYPTSRETRLQVLARADEGFLMAMAYSTQRGYARNHPFAGEIQIGMTDIYYYDELLDMDVCVGEIQISECDMINQFVGNKNNPPQFTRGYGLSFGYNERKVMAMALVDRALQANDYDEEITSPAQQEEFVLGHCDSLDASGFVSHLKLPHYVDFQSELELIRTIHKEINNAQKDDANENNGKQSNE